ncbi:MAG: exosortase/archaeosortase family protein [Planctomycetaceae bacterium]|nr:exosortase/archaeosortase family protein [Planctomycetaceae bacterium]
MSQHPQSNTAGVSSEPVQEPSWLDLGWVTYVKIAFLAGLIWWIFREEIHTIVNRWVTDSSWSHGFLIPFFSLYFLHQNKKNILSIRQFHPSWIIGLGSVLFLLVLYPVDVAVLKFMYGKPLIMIATIGAVVLFLGGWKLLQYTWLPVAYLFFAVPLPQQLYFQITNPMRQLAATVSTMILNLVPQLEATVQGSTIDVIYKGAPLVPGLDVADACSGIRLLMAFVALGVAMAYLHWRPIWQRLILLCSTIPIAIVCNIVRVTITGLIYVLWDPQYAQGIYHDMLGMLMLPLAFCLYGGLAWLMSNLYVDEAGEQKEDIIVRRSLASVKEDLK